MGTNTRQVSGLTRLFVMLRESLLSNFRVWINQSGCRRAREKVPLNLVMRNSALPSALVMTSGRWSGPGGEACKYSHHNHGVLRTLITNTRTAERGERPPRGDNSISIVRRPGTQRLQGRLWQAGPVRYYSDYAAFCSAAVLQSLAEWHDNPVNSRDTGKKILILSSFLQNKSSLPLHLNETCHSLFVFCQVISLPKIGTQSAGWTIPDLSNLERNKSTTLLYFT